MYSWIDNIIEGIKDTYNTSNIYELYDYLNIKIIKLDFNNILLKGNESFYYRNLFESEIVFIRNDLNIHYKKFILSHELGHALLHTHIFEAAFNINLINIGKLEKQANYFAIKLLDIRFDEIQMHQMTYEQIASCVEVPVRALKQLVNL